MKMGKLYSHQTIISNEGTAVDRVVNIDHTNPNIREELQMLKLENEVDPRIVQPKHLKGQKILYRRGEEILMSEVALIGGECYVMYWGASMKITEMDGWVKLPVVSYL